MLHHQVIEAAEEEVRQLASGPGGPLIPRSAADVAWFAGKHVLLFGDPAQLLAVTEQRSPAEVASAQIFSQDWLRTGFKTIELTQSMRVADPAEEPLRRVIEDIRKCRDGDDL
jgi:hypothetical protein